MALSLHSIQPSKGSKKPKKRLGRGLASRGAKSGRGQKGQKARAGASGSARIGIKQFMLATPKLRGFKSLNAEAPVVNVKDLAETFKAGDIVSPKTLEAKKLIRTAANGAKILGVGEISVSITVKNCAVSKTAADKITKAGGTIQA